VLEHAEEDPMDTVYTMINTVTLMGMWNNTDSLIIYIDVPHQVKSITQDRRLVTVTTDLDVFTIMRSDKTTPIWRVLA
jgi:hypothetical protein